MPISFNEKDIENMIVEMVENGEHDKLKSIFNVDSDYFFQNQVKLGGYGILDFISLEQKGNKVKINIYELKVVKSSFEEIGQLARYMRAVELYIINKSLNKNLKFTIHGYLLTPEIDTKNDFVFLMGHLCASGSTLKTKTGINIKSKIDVIKYKFDLSKGATSDMVNWDYCLAKDEGKYNLNLMFDNLTFETSEED